MIKIKEARLSAKGQITVPKAVREMLKVESGQVIAFYIDDNVVKVASVDNVVVMPKDSARELQIQKDCE